MDKQEKGCSTYLSSAWRLPQKSKDFKLKGKPELSASHYSKADVAESSCFSLILKPFDVLWQSAGLCQVGISHFSPNYLLNLLFHISRFSFYHQINMERKVQILPENDLESTSNADYSAMTETSDISTLHSTADSWHFSCRPHILISIFSDLFNLISFLGCSFIISKG